MNFKLITLALTFLMIPLISIAQMQENSGWAAWFNSYRVSDKVGIHFDGQLRTSDDFESIKNVLIRPGVTWFFDDTKNATAGYALIRTYQKLDGISDADLTEHRIWQQFIYHQKVSRASLTHRFRLEQRFIGQLSEDIFSQRLRYFLRAQIPLKNTDNAPFSRGAFVALQNEVFLHLQNRDKLNGYLFDQNRAYVAAGYRFSPAVDLEAGYLNQGSKGRHRSVINNAVQLAVYTRF
ncbi:uncharacterized protein DUF2490 [Arcticibacter pallidicorallinus]|uniref:Uncharacterized protein DUF2490 n=1 Tax=Arcticibacter pallidicorallinus TaxID=1259464 RepID=A0A2T0U9B9_9SPHI|nr:DUF2490 domain-containing protein [Arcticibacter pallidicorallinus]PRY54520.1 uncharacterized protein DUF2490 [Arcticibacter pallidicorallinus]